MIITRLKNQTSALAFHGLIHAVGLTDLRLSGHMWGAFHSLAMGLHQELTAGPLSNRSCCCLWSTVALPLESSCPMGSLVDGREADSVAAKAKASLSETPVR